MKRNKFNPRKILVASAGVATVNYALAVGCSSESGRISTVANLMPSPPSVAGSGGGGGYPTVANLVAPPPPASMGGSAGSGSGLAGASVANLVAPPPEVGGSTFELPDASADADAADADAAAESRN